jgi:hypothetical protein
MRASVGCIEFSEGQGGQHYDRWMRPGVRWIHPLEEVAMNRLLSLIPVAALAAACATSPDQVAQADCKVAPITTTSVTGRARPASSIEQRDAEMQLASTGFRQRELRERGLAPNTVEEALRDCNLSTR